MKWERTLLKFLSGLPFEISVGHHSLCEADRVGVSEGFLWVFSYQDTPDLIRVCTLEKAK